jgi:hypothetical protein
MIYYNFSILLYNFFLFLSHTETQIIRCYPNARRFDSSNFSPIAFWSCGIQMVALNYQTLDSYQLLNLALFEQNLNAGYVLKPNVLWNKLHPEYGRFNPFEKKKDAEYLAFNLKLISGQYLTENTLNSTMPVSALYFSSNNPTLSGFNSGSLNSDINVNNNYNSINSSCNLNLNNHYMNSEYNLNSFNQNHNHHYHHQRSIGVELLQTTNICIEIEILGIPCDCAKEKTKTFNKNALNPIWNEEFSFNVFIFDNKIFLVTVN